MREDVRARTLNVCMMCITTCTAMPARGYAYAHNCAAHTGVNNDAPRVNIMY
jgi:hypothetical protein